MKVKDKRRFHGFRMILLTGLLLIGSALCVHAETAEDFQLIPDYNDGSLEIKYKATGEHVCHLWIEDEIIVPKIAVEGNDIYFTSYSQIGTSDVANCTLRCFNTVDQEVIDLELHLPGSYWQYQIDFIYDGGVFMTGMTSSDEAGSYRYDMNGDYVKKIADGGISYHYKQYVVCDPTCVLGSYAPYTVYVYNADTGKTKTVMTNTAKVSPSGKYLYLAKMKKVNYSPGTKKSTYQIVRYRLTTGKRKTLVPAFKGYHITKITGKYIYYVWEKGGNNRYYRYTIATKKKKRISFATYKKVMVG